MAARHQIDLNALRMFVEIAKTGSMSAAAAVLRVPTSTVSRAVTRLEQALGTALLHRSSRSTRLTAAGSVYLEHVTEALAELDRAHDQVMQDADGLTGPIRITVPPIVAAGLLAPIMAAFRRDHPGVWFEIIASSAVVDLVGEQIDLAVRHAPITGADVVGRRIGTTAPHLYAAPAYVAARGIPRQPGELRDHDHVVFGPHAPGGVLRLYDADGDLRDEAIRPAMVCDDHLVIRQAVLAGMGIGVIPPFFARDDVRDQRLVPVLGRYSLRPVPVWLVSPRVSSRLARVTLFKRLLVQALITSSSRPD